MCTLERYHTSRDSLGHLISKQREEDYILCSSIRSLNANTPDMTGNPTEKRESSHWQQLMAFLNPLYHGVAHRQSGQMSLVEGECRLMS